MVDVPSWRWTTLANMTNKYPNEQRGRTITASQFLERAKEAYGVDYWQFWVIAIGQAPAICPRCQSENMGVLRLADPANRAGSRVWYKWYLWCDSCLYGIYCPPASYWLPEGKPYILWGDERALKQVLPKNLHLIKPKAPDKDENA
jgi:hypothetical protein